MMTLEQSFQILGIDITFDKKEIKKAYIRQLKKTNPEDKPDEFIELRAAYEFALDSLDMAIDINHQIEEIPVTQSIELTKSIENEVNEPNKTVLENSIIYIDEILHEFTKVYNIYQERIEIENWKEIIDFEKFDDMESRILLSDRIFLFFLDHMQLPVNILQYFDQKFDWSVRNLDFKFRYPFALNKIDEFFDRLELPIWEMNYETFIGIKKLDQYIDLRDQVVRELINKQYPKAKRNLNELRRFCVRDPTIRKFMDIIKRKSNHIEKIHKFNKMQDRWKFSRSSGSIGFISIFLIITIIRFCSGSFSNPRTNIYKNLKSYPTHQNTEYFLKEIYKKVNKDFVLNLTSPAFSLDGSEIGSLAINSLKNNNNVHIELNIKAGEFKTPEFYKIQKVYHYPDMRSEIKGSFYKIIDRLFVLGDDTEEYFFALIELKYDPTIFKYFNVSILNKIYYFCFISSSHYSEIQKEILYITTDYILNKYIKYSYTQKPCGIIISEN